MAKKRATKSTFGKYILNCIPSPAQERDWSMASALAAGLLTAGPVPTAKDLRKSWWTIGDQGATGSCVGWATADSVLRWHFVNANRLPTAQRLSPRFIWMAAKETDDYISRPTTFIEQEGTFLKAAVDVAKKFGAVLDSVLPFATGKLFAGDPADFFAMAAQRRIATYHNLGTNLANWRQWIALGGPILTRLGVDATWDNAGNTNGDLVTYQPNTVRGGHAVALVGYTPNYFIVRNSWGTTTWGDKGFGYAYDSYAAAAFTEAYGVVL